MATGARLGRQLDMTGRGHLDPEPGALRTPPLCADSSAEQKRAQGQPERVRHYEAWPAGAYEPPPF